MRLIDADEITEEIKNKKLLAKEPATERCMEIIKNATTYLVPPKNVTIEACDTELKSCPFCGGKVKIDEDDFYMFCCNRCGAGVTFAKELEDGTAADMDKGESIEAWNKRAYDVDKVIKKIKSEFELVVTDYFLQGKYIKKNRAIDIIKAGGENE